MTPIVTQQIPGAMVALFVGANVMSSQHTFASSNAVTLEWKIEELLPTRCSNLLAVKDPPMPVKNAGLALSALAKAVLADSRPMSAGEREDADEFFRSQFA